MMHRTIMFASHLPLGTSYTPGMLPLHRRPIQTILALLADLLGSPRYWLARSFLFLVFKPHEFMLVAGGTVFAPYYHTTHENRSIDLPFLMILA